MSDKKLVGEAARKANLEKARKLVAKKETPNQTMARVLGTTPIVGVSVIIPDMTAAVKPTEATTDNKEVLSDASATVVQKPKKSTAKKPTAEALGVRQVVGGCGKVRSENPVTVEPTMEDKLKAVDVILDDCERMITKLEKRTSKKDITEDLAEYWKEATAHHAPEGYGIAREIQQRLGKPWWTIAEKGETLASLMGRAIKSLTERQVTATAVALTPTITRIETPKQIIISEPAVPKHIVIKTVRPKGEEIYGYAPTAILRWCGYHGWTKDETLKALRAKGWMGAEATVPIQMGAGKKGGDCGGRGPVPQLTDTDCKELEQLAGRSPSVQVYSKGIK